MITIGSVIHPSYNWDLDSSLRVHRLLVERSLEVKWRFKSTNITTGPFETLMGFSSCGSGSGSTEWAILKLYVRDGLGEMVKAVNRRILNAMCVYPELAMLRETIPDRPVANCCEAIDKLLAYEKGRTRQQLNRHHKKATLVKDVRLECRDSGVVLAAQVSFNTKPTESSWELWWLAKMKVPQWNERHRLPTWLESAAATMGKIVCESK